MKITENDILFEDNHLIIVNKKSGWLVQPDKGNDPSIETELKEFLKNKYAKPGNVYLGIAHRIDRPTSGIVLMTKTSKALTRVNEMFNKREVKKTYWAVVKNKPAKSEGRLTHYLLRNEKTNTTKAFDKEVAHSQQAILDYKVISSIDNYHLLEVDLHTGRHHQIRSQLKAIGCSIKGDLKYGFDRSNKDGSIHLHARQLSFIHPVNGEQINIVAAPPEEVVWNALVKNVK